MATYCATMKITYSLKQNMTNVSLCYSTCNLHVLVRLVELNEGPKSSCSCANLYN